MTTSGYFEDLIGAKFTILLGSTIMTSGVLRTYFSIQHSLVFTAITYGVMFGLGIALSYGPPLVVAMRWFPNKKGFVNGIIVGGFGLGAFIFNPVQTTYLNPRNLPGGPDGYFHEVIFRDRL